MRLIDKNIEKSMDFNKCVAAFNKCMTEFTMFHVLNRMMYQEAVKAFDLIEEDPKLNRFKVKSLKKQAESVWDKYIGKLQRDLKTDEYYLLMDYSNTAYDSAEPHLINLFVSMSNLLANQPKEHKNRRIIAQCMVVQVMSSIIHDTWNSFFKIYKEYCGLNFESDFRYADLSPFMVYIQRLTEEISIGNPSVDFGKDPKCMAAFRALKNNINREDFFDNAAKVAISYSPTISKKYQEDMKRIEEERTEKERDDLAAKLSEKFKVTKK